jgi:L-alanine-DL-glutamate epimerase-like enolase superfamily enzyme
LKITEVKVDLYQYPPQPAFKWRFGLPGSDPGGVGARLRLVTDDGLEGWAFCNRGRILDDLINRRIRQELLGQDPLQREWLWHRMWELDRIEEFPIYVLGLVDVALWDLAAKAANLPLYQLLGGFRTSLPAYASTVTFSTIEEYLDVADQCIALGYPAIKLHAWGDARKDAKLGQALRNHVGPDYPLMYDGSAGFDLPDAVYLGHALGEADYLWYEEPLREFNVTAYKRLAERVSIPLNIAETSDGAHMNTADFIAAGCATFVRTSAGLRGGVTGAMRIAHLADAYRLRAEVHGDGLLHRHLCMAISNTTYYESLVKTNPVVRAPEIDANGLIHAPTAIGVGFEAEFTVTEDKFLERQELVARA